MGAVITITNTGGEGANAYGREPQVDPSILTARVADVHDKIEAGLPDEAYRLSAAQANAAFFRAQNIGYLENREAETDQDFRNRPHRVCYLTKHAVNRLGAKLYSPAPSRAFRPAGAAANLLHLVYRTARADVAFAAANRWAILNDTAAVQVVCTGNPRKPVRFYVRGAQEFVAYCPPEDPITPWCVVTIAIAQAGVGKKQRVYTCWTADQIREYRTRPVAQFETTGGTRAYLQQGYPKANPYKCLPFAFFHNESPTDQFWGSGIGDALRVINADVDRELSDLAQAVELFICPDMFSRGTSAEFRYKKAPGRPQKLTSLSEITKGEFDVEADVFFRQPSLAVEQVWYGIEKTVNRLFMDLDIPLCSVRDGSGAPTSGLQVIAENIPYLDYLKDRQQVVTPFEHETAVTVLRCCGAYYDQPALAAAADTLELDQVWPEPSLPVPSPEADAEDQWDLDNGLASPIEVLMRRRGLTRKQAVEAAMQIKEDNETWASIFPAPAAGQVDAPQETDDEGNPIPKPTDPPAQPAGIQGEVAEDMGAIADPVDEL